MTKIWRYFLVAQYMVLSHCAKFQLITNFFWVKAISTRLFCRLDVSAQFFRDHLFVQSTCDHFVPAVHSSDVLLYPHCGMSSCLGIILLFLAAFHEMLAPFKILHPRHHIFTIPFFKKFKILSWGIL